MDYGECHVTRKINENTFLPEILIDRADDRILIHRVLVDEVYECPSEMFWAEGDLINFKGVNRHVVYRLGGYLPDIESYQATKAWDDCGW